ncbi:ABC-type lipoprotein export system, ATPase component [Carnobacterium alterfunditum]|uniref:ABC-type lipoprotein export system, ATPase component n=1 Tax=Carnobacterium alterfunditum TaxID=28230 RepID=A0A1N6GZ11_9LACT|nr:ABC transporter ATP-binding protein/permease [Carnobacterium alterfunditum]SIO12784.1 ABC-type lipoprotein export system, ATPase component [Carnobacterium alterfunditum]
MPIMQLKEVNKYYKSTNGNKFHALKQINVSFEKGELVSIIGESGSGKSTLMNVLGGLDSNFEGNVLYNGKNIGNYSEKELVRYHKSNVGFVFQSFNLIAHLSILDNVTLAMTLSNVSKAEKEKRAKEILSLVGLEDHLTKKPDAISGGQKQRVAIARALVNDPDIIIADEPTGALDSETTDQVLDLIKEIAENGKLVIMVTHSDKVAERSSRVVKIDDGLIVSDTLGITLNSSKDNDFKEDATIKAKYTKKNLSLLGSMKLAVKNMQAKWSRNVLIALGSSIGIMSVILMLGLGNGVNTYIENTMNSQVNPLVVEVNMPTKVPDPNDTNPLASIMEVTPFTEEDIAKLEGIENVTLVEEGFSGFSLGSNKVTLNDITATFMNLNTLSAAITESDILSGKMPSENELLVTQAMATTLANGEDENSVIGKEITLDAVANKTAVSATQKISGIFAADSLSTSSVYMNYTTLGSLVVSKEDIELEPNVMHLTANDKDNREGISDKISELGYQGSAIESITKIFTQMSDIFTYVLAGVAGISLVVSAIMILTVLYISVVERTKEIGVMKAIGARNKDIKRIFTAEAFLIGLFSATFGVVIASILEYFANNLTFKYFDVNMIDITPTFILSGMLISILISMLAGVLPASKAAKLDPVEALKRD